MLLPLCHTLRPSQLPRWRCGWFRQLIRTAHIHASASQCTPSAATMHHMTIPLRVRVHTHAVATAVPCLPVAAASCLFRTACACTSCCHQCIHMWPPPAHTHTPLPCAAAATAMWALLHILLTVSRPSCVDLVQCGQVVHPVEGGTSPLIKTSNQEVAVVGRLHITEVSTRIDTLIGSRGCSGCSGRGTVQHTSQLVHECVVKLVPAASRGTNELSKGSAATVLPLCVA